ncbi:MAG: M48 family metalloprotease [Acidobacteriota bacterium]
MCIARRIPRHRWLARLLAGLLVGGCAGPTRVPPIGAGQEGRSFVPDRDEAQLWRRSAEEEHKLQTSGALYEDPLLAAYLDRLALKLAPATLQEAAAVHLQIHVLDDPSLNAFSYPTGGVYVHTGLLARLETEAQLATVLGHEIMHIHGRHLLQAHRSSHRKAVGTTIAGIAGSLVLAGAAGHRAGTGHATQAYVINQVGNIMLHLGLTLGLEAAVNGFGRRLEREADRGAVQLLEAAGYDLREAPKVFHLLQEDYGDSHKIETFFYGSHPSNHQRELQFQEWLEGADAEAAAEEERTVDTEEFHLRTRSMLRDNAEMNLAAARLGTAAADLKKVLGMTPNDPVAQFLMGEVHRRRAERTDVPREAAREEEQALASYRKAADLDPGYPEPWRAIGLIHYERREQAAALTAFRKYLDLAPAGAPERKRVRDYILELEAAGP